MLKSESPFGLAALALLVSACAAYCGDHCVWRWVSGADDRRRHWLVRDWCGPATGYALVGAYRVLAGDDWRRLCDGHGHGADGPDRDGAVWDYGGGLDRGGFVVCGVVEEPCARSAIAVVAA